MSEPTRSQHSRSADRPAHRRGFTLLELIVSLVLAGIIGAVAVGTTVSCARFFRRQSERVEVQRNLRVAASLFVSELRGLNAAGGDLIETGPSSLVYRAMRNTSFLCRVPDAIGETMTVEQETSFGLRNIEAGRDSVLVMLEHDFRTEADNAWVSAGVVSVASAVCPEASPGLRIGVGGLTEVSLASALVGAPVRAFQVTDVRLYRDGGGVFWLGFREWKPGSGWSTVQPAVGPLTGEGLRLVYYDTSGNETARPDEVEMVGVTIVAAGSRPPGPGWLWGGEISDSVRILVALRNNSRW